MKAPSEEMRTLNFYIDPKLIDYRPTKRHSTADMRLPILVITH